MPSNTATLRSRNCDLKSASTGNDDSARSVTISGRLWPISSRCGPASLRAPAPKWIVVGKAKRTMLMMRIAAAGRAGSGSREPVDEQRRADRAALDRRDLQVLVVGVRAPARRAEAIDAHGVRRDEL